MPGIVPFFHAGKQVAVADEPSKPQPLMRPDSLSELRIADVLTFLELRRLGSMTLVARELNVTPSQVSKAIARLESVLQVSLITRGPKGIILTEAAQRMVPQLQGVVDSLQMMRQREQSTSPEVTLASPAFLGALLFPAIAEAVPELKVRGLELAPVLVRAHAADHLFDMALVEDASRLPPNWSAVQLGRLRRALFGPPALAAQLGVGPISADKVRTLKFVTPTYVVDGRLMPGDDECPLRLADRRIGHETQTLAAALALAARSQQVVFAPVIAAFSYLRSNALVEIRVKGWHVESTLFLACDADRVRARIQAAVAGALKAAMLEYGAG